MKELILASSSPRRAAILRRLGVMNFRVVAPSTDESALAGELPRAYVCRVARQKLESVACLQAEGVVVLSGDVAVGVGRRILGKPADEGEARRQLLLMSGRRHRVHGAVCVGVAGATTAALEVRWRYACSVVGFKRFSARELDSYLASGEWRDAAGSYSIQGSAEGFVRFLSGSYSNVVGLPMFEARSLLAWARVLPS